MSKMKFFFTSANGPSSVYLAKEFKKLGYCICMGDLNPDSIGKHFSDYFFSLPSQSSAGYVDILLEIVKSENITILVPLGENECLKVAKRKQEFLALGCTPIVIDQNTIETSIDKSRLYDFLSSETDIPMMAYSTVDSYESFQTSLSNEIFKDKKLCIKPASGSGSRGFTIINDTPQDAIEYFTSKKTFPEAKSEVIANILKNSNDIPKLLLMEMVEGPEYDSTVICKNGEVVFQSIRTREASINGTITRGKIVEVPELYEINRKIAAALKTDGYICTQYIGNKLIEINPRWSTSLNYENFNEYLFSVELALGEKPSIPENLKSYNDVKMLRYFDILIYR